MIGPHHPLQQSRDFLQGASKVVQIKVNSIAYSGELYRHKDLMRRVIHCGAFCRTKTGRAYNVNPPCPTKLGDGI